MNDIIISLENSDTISNFILFADDTKIFGTDPVKLQYSLNNFNLRLQKFQLNLSAHKCAIVPICKQPFSSLTSSLSPITVNSFQLPYLQFYKDLGIYVSSNLKWDNHIAKIVNSASTTSYQILKTCKTKNIWTLVKLFQTYIRPKLEYNTEIWSPHLLKDINSVERVQRRYTKTICQRCGIPYGSYEDRLNKLNLQSLENRRIRYDLILMYKIFHGHHDLPFHSFFKLQTSSYSLRSTTQKIIPIKSYNSSAWLNSFFVRGPKYFNNLPVEISSTKSLFGFKSKIKKLNFNIFKPKY